MPAFYFIGLFVSNESLKIMKNVETPAEPLLWGVDELALQLSIPRRAVYSLMNAGRLPESVKLGKRRLWKRQDIVEWVRLDMPPLEKFKVLCGRQQN